MPVNVYIENQHEEHPVTSIMGSASTDASYIGPSNTGRAIRKLDVQLLFVKMPYNGTAPWTANFLIHTVGTIEASDCVKISHNDGHGYATRERLRPSSFARYRAASAA